MVPFLAFQQSEREESLHYFPISCNYPNSNISRAHIDERILKTPEFSVVTILTEMYVLRMRTAIASLNILLCMIVAEVLAEHRFNQHENKMAHAAADYR